MQSYLVETSEKKYLTPNVIELWVKLVKPRSMKFLAGQFVFFNIGGPFKAYTITSNPDDKHCLRFLIKLEPDGVGSQFVSNLKIADRFELTGPEGYFTVRKRTGDLCFVALGVGLAPFMSIIPGLLEKKFKGTITLLYGYRSDVVYYDKLAELAKWHTQFQFLPLPSTTQRVTGYLESHYQTFKNHVFYICGKLQAVTDVENALNLQGHNAEKVITEVFLR